MRTLTLLSTLVLAATPALAADPWEKPDDSWVAVSGTAVSPTDDSFILDYGDGLITVEADDWDRVGDAIGLLDGDRVTVYGRIDDDLYESRTIEAGSIYVESLNTTFDASAADEEDLIAWSITAPIEVSRTSVKGTVTSVDTIADEIVVGSGKAALTVDVDEMAYDPLDDQGFQKIEVGDFVSASGHMDRDFLEGRELEANSVVTLRDAPMDQKTARRGNRRRR